MRRFELRDCIISLVLAWASTFTAAQTCTRAESTALTCQCRASSHVIYDYTLRDNLGRVCGKSSDACLCPAGEGPGTVGTSTLSFGIGSHGPLPPGTFDKSCTGCEMRDSILTCRACRKRGGGSSDYASINVNSCGGGIENDNGVLRCPGRPAITGETRPTPPPLMGQMQPPSTGSRGRENVSVGNRTPAKPNKPPPAPFSDF